MTNETITDVNSEGTILNLVDGQSLPINVSKTGYETHSENLIVDKNNLNVDVVLIEEQTDLIFVYDSSINRTFSSHHHPLIFTGEYTVDFGDGTVITESDNSKAITHTYENDDIYNIKISGNVTELQVYSFSNFDAYPNGIIEIKIPNSITSVGMQSFVRCYNLEKINLPLNTVIGSMCFQQCNNLTTVEIPQGYTTLTNGLFYECVGMEEIEIPSSVTEIQNGVFAFTNLTTINIPSSITTLGINIFGNCANLIEIQLNWEGENIVQKESNTFNEGENTVFSIPKNSINDYINKGYPSEKLVERDN